MLINTILKGKEFKDVVFHTEITTVLMFCCSTNRKLQVNYSTHRKKPTRHSLKRCYPGRFSRVNQPDSVCWFIYLCLTNQANFRDECTFKNVSLLWFGNAQITQSHQDILMKMGKALSIILALIFNSHPKCMQAIFKLPPQPFNTSFTINPGQFNGV